MYSINFNWFRFIAIGVVPFLLLVYFNTQIYLGKGPFKYYVNRVGGFGQMLTFAYNVVGYRFIAIDVGPFCYILVYFNTQIYLDKILEIFVFFFIY